MSVIARISYNHVKAKRIVQNVVLISVAIISIVEAQ